MINNKIWVLFDQFCHADVITMDEKKQSSRTHFLCII
jgi:hypothetical protein